MLRFLEEELGRQHETDEFDHRISRNLGRSRHRDTLSSVRLLLRGPQSIWMGLGSARIIRVRERPSPEGVCHTHPARVLVLRHLLPLKTFDTARTARLFMILDFSLLYRMRSAS